jgi:hypothetical protein
MMSEDMNFKIDIPWKALTVFVDGFYCWSNSLSPTLFHSWALEYCLLLVDAYK